MSTVRNQREKPIGHKAEIRIASRSRPAIGYGEKLAQKQTNNSHKQKVPYYCFWFPHRMSHQESSIHLSLVLTRDQPA